MKLASPLPDRERKRRRAMPSPMPEWMQAVMVVLFLLWGVFGHPKQIYERAVVGDGSDRLAETEKQYDALNRETYTEWADGSGGDGNHSN